MGAAAPLVIALGRSSPDGSAALAPGEFLPGFGAQPSPLCGFLRNSRKTELYPEATWREESGIAAANN
jgi:hypothetical protein